MSKSLILLTGVLLLASGCAQHSQAWNDAWAQCQAQAQEQMETAEVDHDQRSEYLQNASNECMRGKGFDVSDTM